MRRSIPRVVHLAAFVDVLVHARRGKSVFMIRDAFALVGMARSLNGALCTNISGWLGTLSCGV
jgi:hypothetical protein